MLERLYTDADDGPQNAFERLRLCEKQQKEKRKKGKKEK